MKKIITVLFALLLVLSLSACQKGGESTNKDPEPGMLGGWKVNDDFARVTDAQDVVEFVNSNAKKDDSNIKVVAVLGTQVVSGTNYLLLGEYTADKASEAKALVTLVAYKNLEGEISIVNCKDFNLADYTNEDDSLEEKDLVGAYEYYTDSAVINAEPLTKALQKFTGANYEAVQLLGTQVVSGTNYAYLAVGNRVVPNAKKFIAVVTVYENTSGECSILSIDQLDLAALAE